jgi:serine/threonine protein kinase
VLFRFHFAFQDPEYLFMCMDLVPGGMLLDLINEKQREWLEKNIPNKACNFECTQFYIAEIVEALHYLHNAGIIHRDLKPESEQTDIFSNEKQI